MLSVSDGLTGLHVHAYSGVMCMSVRSVCLSWVLICANKWKRVEQLTRQQSLLHLLWPSLLPKIQLHSVLTHNALSHVLWGKKSITSTVSGVSLTLCLILPTDLRCTCSSCAPMPVTLFLFLVLHSIIKNKVCRVKKLSMCGCKRRKALMTTKSYSKEVAAPGAKFSHASFKHSKLLQCIITQWCTPKHETIASNPFPS